MTDPRSIVRGFLTALWSNDRDAAKSHLVPGAQWYFAPSLGYPVPMSAEDAIDAVIDDMIGAFSEGARLETEIHALVGDDVSVACEYTARSATDKGIEYENRYCLRADVVDGKIVEIRPYMDTKALSDLMAGEKP